MRAPIAILAGLILPAFLGSSALSASPGEARQLLVSGHDPQTGNLTMTYDPGCDATDHHIEFGPLDEVDSLEWSGQECGIGTTGTYADFSPGADSWFFVVVADDGTGIEGSYGAAVFDGVAEERTPDKAGVACPFVQDLTDRCDVPMLPSVELIAYRPQSESYGGPFRRTAVPQSEELTPGVGVRVNRDDDNGNGTPDAEDAPVPFENDLVEVVLTVAPRVAPGNLEYVLQCDDAVVRVWNEATKGTELLGASDTEVVTFATPARSVWVEMPRATEATLKLFARSIPDQEPVALDEVGLFAFSSVVIALGGEGQVPADPPLEPGNHGTFQLAIELYREGYDVHMYDEDVVAATGAGAAFDEVVSAVQNRGVVSVAIYGYSHGAGSTNDLARRLDDNRAAIGDFGIDFTGYVDAIDNDTDFDVGTETELPPSTGYHANYYENPGCGFFALCGGPISGAAFDLDVNTTPWGVALDHFAVDDAAEVLGGLRDQLMPRVPR